MAAKKPTQKKRTLRVSVTQEEYERLSTAAMSCGITVPRFATQGIFRWLEAYEKKTRKG
jgi:hypothetical protein